MKTRGARARGLVAIAVLLTASLAAGGRHLPNLFRFDNPDGAAATYSEAGALDLGNPFFQSLGTNGRACVTCHRPAEGWSFTPAAAQALFDATDGNDPLFRPVDGANAPTLPVASVDDRRRAYSLLLTRGVIRVGLPLPAEADFVLDAIDDPWGYASPAELSLFRRPLPSTNLAFLTTVMWDGRETVSGETIHFALAQQANGATVGHAEGDPLSPEDREAIVRFETSLTTAQVRDHRAGELQAAGARGGPMDLARQVFYPGINSSADGGFHPDVFTLFDAWRWTTGRWAGARQAVERGQRLFNQRTFGPRASTCSSCHNAPNAGSSSLGRFFDVGVAHADRRTADLPLYTFRCVRGGTVVRTGQIVQLSDPGRALVTGRCDDLGRFKVPALRGLAARAPYFHNGSAPTLEAVVELYDLRFGIGLTHLDREDLVAFLRAL